MLETVREFGLEQLTAAGEEPSTRARHAEYYEALAQRAAPHFLRSEQLAWLVRTDAELDNLRTVLQWLLDHGHRERGQILASSLWYFWSIHGRVSEGREWLTRLLEGRAGEATPPLARGRAQLALGLTAAKQTDIAACLAAFTESLSLGRRTGDAWTTAMSLVRSAWIAERAATWTSSSRREVADSPDHTRPIPPEPFDEALAAGQFDEAQAIFRRLSDDWGTAYCLMEYAGFLASRDPARARQLATESAQIAHGLGDRYTLAGSLGNLARHAIAAGESTEARRLVERSLALSRELNDLFSESIWTDLIAQRDMDAAQFADALAFHEQRAASLRLVGNGPELAHALHDVAIAARLVGDADRALQASEESLALFQDLGHSAEVAAMRASLGHVHRHRGAFALAAAMFVESVRELRRQESELGLATVLSGLGGMALDAGRPADAARLLGAAEALLERLQTGPQGVHFRPSQTGLRGRQFRRDSRHARELRAAGSAAFEAMGPQTFDAALDAGRALSTAEAIVLGLEQAERSAEDAAGWERNQAKSTLANST